MLHRTLPRLAKVTSYDAFLSQRSRARKPSAIRALQPLLAEPGMISLGGGMPNPSTFPFDSIRVTLSSSATTTSSTDSNTKSGNEFELKGQALEDILQYSGTRGINTLLPHLFDLQSSEHGRVQPKPFEICVTTGSQDALSKAFDLFTGAGADEPPMLVEEPTYSGSLAYLQPTGTRLVGVKCDGQGLIPESLDSILRNWETDQPKNHPRPKVLYTIPTGSNPTGASLSVERKRKIYSIASEFNLLILEDDPYYWMQYDEEKEEEEEKTEEESSRNTSSSSKKQQLEQKQQQQGKRTASFMSMDVEGRVLRFDSFSKLLSSGIRVGFVTGPPALIERIEYHAQASVLHSSAVSQALVAGLFDHWKEQSGGISSYNGFVNHCYGITEFYRLRRNNFVKSARKHLNGLVEFTVPSAGMFCWMKFLDVEDADQFIKEKARDAKVLLVPGQSFDPLNRVSPWARAAYSTASAEDMDVALERLGELLREQKNQKNLKNK